MGVIEDDILLGCKDGKYSIEQASRLLGELQKLAVNHPLSEGQKGLWLLEKSDPGAAAYNVPICLSCPRSLDAALFRKACELTLRQHPLLNCIIREEGGIPYLRLRPPQAVEVLQQDIRSCTEEQVTTLLQRAAEAPFDINQGPLIRFAIYGRENRCYVLIVVHHIVFDGASAGILLESLRLAYDSLLSHRPVSLQKPAGSYFDFVVWERELIQSERGRQCLAYWKNRLADIPQIARLTIEKSQDVTGAATADTRSLQVSGALAGEIRKFSHLNQLNVPVLFLGLYQMLLQRYTGEHDVVVGMATAGRHKSAWDDLIGYFVNMIPIRSAVQDEQPLQEFLQRVKKAVVEGLDHSAYPFPLLVRELAAAHQRGISPIFQVGFAYQGRSLFGRKKSPEHSGADWEPVKNVHQQGEFKLVLEIYEEKEGFTLNLKYGRRYFDAATIESLGGHYLALLEEVIRTPSRSIGEYSMLSARELNERRTANATHAEQFDCCLHSRFVENARRDPQRIALEYSGGQMTYGELLQRSCSLAQQLQSRGACRNQLIGVVLERGWEQVVAVLGILLSGAAYLPIDPRWPAQRRAYLLEQGEARIVVTQKKLNEEFEWAADIQRVCVSHEDEFAQASVVLPSGQSIDDLAYVIFTSGSTGTPKGVMIDHKGAVNTVLHINRLYGVSEQDKVLAVSELTFDLSVYDLFGLLGAGGTVVIPDVSLARDPEHWQALVRQHGVTVWNSVPQLMSMLVDMVELSGSQPLSSVRLVMMSGDWIPVRLPDRIKAISPDVGVIGMGGATEGSIWSIYYRIAEVPPQWESIPYGKALPNQHMYVLDGQLQPCADWITGDIYIGGVGVALGYWKNAAQTQAQFMIHPHSGERIYKTGDLGRVMPGGDIEFLGRIDQQVKVRGFRIELGEIEAQLRRHPQVREVVVIVREDAPSEKRLVAYYTAEEGEAPSLEQLRAHLQQSLPEYMVPSAYVALGVLPLTSNGKVDKKALPRPELGAGTAERYQAPQGKSETLLAQIWQELLSVERVGRHDNFFELGGHSLLIMQVIERLKRRGLHAQASRLFAAPSLCEMAAAVTIKGDPGDTDRVVIPANPLNHESKGQASLVVKL